MCAVYVAWPGVGGRVSSGGTRRPKWHKRREPFFYEWMQWRLIVACDKYREQRKDVKGVVK